MRDKRRGALTCGLIVSIALVSGACGRSDADSAPQPTVRAAAEARSPTPMSSVAATAGVVRVSPAPTQAALDLAATQTSPPRGFADAAPPARTPLPPPAGACPGGCAVPPQGCLIKGTLPRVDDKVFLLPGQPGYAPAQIDAQKGERWFCSIAEAQAAGWMPSKAPLPAHAPVP